jgi:hypothetical protein
VLLLHAAKEVEVLLRKLAEFLERHGGRRVVLCAG